MTVFRVLAMALVASLLAACDEPAKAPPPLPSPPQTEPAPAPAAPDESAEPEQAVEPAVVERAIEPPKPPKAPAIPAKPTPVVAEPAEVAPLRPVTLDLRLPKETVEPLTSDAPPADLVDQALLPPLFQEQPANPGPFQLNGRLITNERDDDYWQSVEGAELQIEFRN